LLLPGGDNLQRRHDEIRRSSQARLFEVSKTRQCLLQAEFRVLRKRKPSRRTQLNQPSELIENRNAGPDHPLRRLDGRRVRFFLLSIIISGCQEPKRGSFPDKFLSYSFYLDCEAIQLILQLHFRASFLFDS